MWGCIADNLLPFAGKVIIISGQRGAYVMNGRLNGLRLRDIFRVIPLDTLRLNFCFQFFLFQLFSSQQLFWPTIYGSDPFGVARAKTFS